MRKQQLINRQKRQIAAILRYVILIIFAIIMSYPLLWLVGASFKSNHEIFSSASVFPSNIDFSSYINGWKTKTEYTFLTYFLNTFKYVIPKVILTTISSILVAYGFARFPIPGKKIWFSCMMLTILLPTSVLMVPQYLMYKEFGWLDTFFPLVVPTAFAVQGFFVFMVTQFLRGIPIDMEEAAIIDGASSFQVLFYVVVPLIKPAIISVALFQFMWSMNDFLGPLIYISSVDKYPVSLALKMAMDVTEATNWNEILAMSVVTLIPSITIFFMAQKTFVEGISSGAIKS